MPDSFFFSFFGGVFVGFWYQGNGGFIECLWEGSFLFSFLEEFEKDGYKFFSVRLVEFACEAIWPWISCLIHKSGLAMTFSPLGEIHTPSWPRTPISEAPSLMGAWRLVGCLRPTGGV